MTHRGETERRIALARTYVDRVWNDEAFSDVTEFVAEDVTCRGTSFGDFDGIDALTEFVEMSRTAFPGLVYRIDEITTESEFVDVDWVATATERPNRVAASGEAILRIDGGEIGTVWYNFDPWQARVHQ